MHIVNPAIEDYLFSLYQDDDHLRREMEQLAREKKFPIVGPLVGRHLSVLAGAIGAQRVFELGSGFGYSALFFAKAVGPHGHVHCTDLSAENRELAHGFLSRAGLWPRITYHQKDATQALRDVGGTWDIIYNDIDKEGYPQVVELAHEHLRPGGLFISDNVLWYGRVLPGQDDGSRATAGIKEFTRRLMSHPGFLTTIDPTRDGLAVALRL